MQLELSDAERDLLVQVLESAVKEMRVEVRRTSTPDYHDRLAAEEKTLEGLLERARGLGG